MYRHDLYEFGFGDVTRKYMTCEIPRFLRVIRNGGTVLNSGRHGTVIALDGCVYGGSKLLIHIYIYKRFQPSSYIPSNRIPSSLFQTSITSHSPLPYLNHLH